MTQGTCVELPGQQGGFCWGFSSQCERLSPHLVCLLVLLIVFRVFMVFSSSTRRSLRCPSGCWARQRSPAYRRPSGWEAWALRLWSRAPPAWGLGLRASHASQAPEGVVPAAHHTHMLNAGRGLRPERFAGDQAPRRRPGSNTSLQRAQDPRCWATNFYHLLVAKLYCLAQ